ncbi:MAG: hypothetical protein R3Y63_03770 [Eubacteriales bacterium]
MKNSKKFTFYLNIVLGLFLLLNYLIYLPNLNPLYGEGAFALLLTASLFFVINSPSALSSVTVLREGKTNFNVKVDRKAKGVQKILKILGTLWGLYFLAFVLSTPLFRSSAYRDQLGTPNISDFSDDIQLVDLSQVPIVDKALAATLADKKLGENPGMGSQVFLGEPVIQQVNGELLWIVPLQHSGFFKWLQNNQGSAGYIRVSATNQQDIQFVETPIKYQPYSFFWDDITRYLRTVKGYVFSGLTDYSFEIDDNDEPYWIITTYENAWLYALPEATGVITLHASTGETDHYAIEEVPQWVDRVQPEDFIVNQINNQGLFVHGVFNFSNKDKFQSSREEAIIYNEGNCYLFTGLTSVGTDESAIGFIMVNMVTKESKIYQIPGATENKAMESAQGEVQQYGYYATSPIIINHKSIPTYFITLKDNGGLIKQYAFVSVADVTTVGAGETIALALRDYDLSLSATNTFVQNTGEELSFTGTVERIAYENTGMDENYKLILKEKNDKIFLLAPELSQELALTMVGDQVTLYYYQTEDGVITATQFDNKEYNQSE